MANLENLISEVRLGTEVGDFPGQEGYVQSLLDELSEIYTEKSRFIMQRLTRYCPLIKSGKVLTAQTLDNHYGIAPWRS